MGNIGPARLRFEVLPAHAFGLCDADRWTAAPRMTVPAPEPMPVPQPEPVPEPSPLPGPEPSPGPEPVPGPPSVEHHLLPADGWLARTARVLR